METRLHDCPTGINSKGQKKPKSPKKIRNVFESGTQLDLFIGLECIDGPGWFQSSDWRCR